MPDQSRPFNQRLTPYFEEVLKVVLQDAEENRRRKERAGLDSSGRPKGPELKDLKKPRPSPQ